MGWVILVLSGLLLLLVFALDEINKEKEKLRQEREYLLVKNAELETEVRMLRERA